jgi:hypothetical protein
LDWQMLYTAFIPAIFIATKDLDLNIHVICMIS